MALGRDVAQLYEATYYPNLNGSSHNVRVPLMEIDPNTNCMWKPVMAFVCVSLQSDEPTNCSSVFSFRGKQNIANTTLECWDSLFCYDSKSNLGKGEINEFNRAYHLDIVKNKM